MKKRELLAMRRLNATKKMVGIAKKDVPKKVAINTYWGPARRYAGSISSLCAVIWKTVF